MPVGQTGKVATYDYGISCAHLLSTGGNGVVYGLRIVTFRVMENLIAYLSQKAGEVGKAYELRRCRICGYRLVLISNISDTQDI